ncbi:hypothetical protein [Stackebrandtia soli]|uniref:hypothetical protein n=1 Tax=Stackebrandtia soli TaxID=1892856 RepID=UPI0039ECA8BD
MKARPPAHAAQPVPRVFGHRRVLFDHRGYSDEVTRARHAYSRDGSAEAAREPMRRESNPATLVMSNRHTTKGPS